MHCLPACLRAALLCAHTPALCSACSRWCRPQPCFHICRAGGAAPAAAAAAHLATVHSTAGIQTLETCLQAGGQTRSHTRLHTHTHTHTRGSRCDIAFGQTDGKGDGSTCDFDVRERVTQVLLHNGSATPGVCRLEDGHSTHNRAKHKQKHTWPGVTFSSASSTKTGLTGVAKYALPSGGETVAAQQHQNPNKLVCVYGGFWS